MHMSGSDKASGHVPCLILNRLLGLELFQVGQLFVRFVRSGQSTRSPSFGVLNLR